MYSHFGVPHDDATVFDVLAVRPVSSPEHSEALEGVVPVQEWEGMVYSHLRVLVHDGTCSHAVLDVRSVVSFVHHEAPYGGLPPVQE